MTRLWKRSIQEAVTAQFARSSENGGITVYIRNISHSFFPTEFHPEPAPVTSSQEPDVRTDSILRCTVRKPRRGRVYGKRSRVHCSPFLARYCPITIFNRESRMQKSARRRDARGSRANRRWQPETHWPSSAQFASSPCIAAPCCILRDVIAHPRPTHGCRDYPLCSATTSTLSARVDSARFGFMPPSAVPRCAPREMCTWKVKQEYYPGGD